MISVRSKNSLLVLTTKKHSVKRFSVLRKLRVYSETRNPALTRLRKKVVTLDRN